ncbi:Octaprenyl-diphosphate synthase [Fructilactobacillus florum 8D]|uniref:Farnesyl diphosphate synthase n=1 Tax=Fructilactobacillus florum 8D TaxID=1221538 RepID=W9EDM8_9LACO|nr:polyprenyl synthetase family protein [Fructilactobacillus florum]ETO40187.1 Octaprenyl-diphosphate synthase [Fructilactobacillus florum 8D]
MTTSGTNLHQFEQTYRPKIEQALQAELTNNAANQRLEAAMRYSVFAGGKRLRPLLTLAVIAAYQHPITEEVVQAASAVELLHTYSLIHDDLPEMDDSDMRRGRLANHKQFDQATAVLAGDGLLTLSFGWLASLSLKPKLAIALVRQLALAAGPLGMVAGQVTDVTATQPLNADELAQLDRQKTGELFHYCVIAGALLVGVSKTEHQALAIFAEQFGLAFQIYDDIKDSENGDEDAGKNTYMNRLGSSQAVASLKQAITAGQTALASLKDCPHPELLQAFFSYFKI